MSFKRSAHNTYNVNSRTNKIHHLNLNKNRFYRKLSNYNHNRGNGEKGVGESGALVHVREKLTARLKRERETGNIKLNINCDTAITYLKEYTGNILRMTRVSQRVHVST